MTQNTRRTTRLNTNANVLAHAIGQWLYDPGFARWMTTMVGPIPRQFSNHG